VCRTNPHPPLEEKGPDHLVSCYRADEIEELVEIDAAKAEAAKAEAATAEAATA
jgi:hypothetical protein